jgi:RNA polymerase-binding transcription factor DksA
MRLPGINPIIDKLEYVFYGNLINILDISKISELLNQDLVEVHMGSKINDDIKKGLSETGENLYHWLEATPEEKQHICLGPQDETCVDEHLNVINESLEKIEEGTFGICEICNQPVDDELLKMDYTATVCLGHYICEIFIIPRH